ncbi:UNVERIFIED_CONTAM: hypothetical protein K2H54_056085 [Gekko kuhli]
MGSACQRAFWESGAQNTKAFWESGEQITKAFRKSAEQIIKAFRKSGEQTTKAFRKSGEQTTKAFWESAEQIIKAFRKSGAQNTKAASKVVDSRSRRAEPCICQPIQWGKLHQVERTVFPPGGVRPPASRAYPGCEWRDVPVDPLVRELLQGSQRAAQGTSGQSQHPDISAISLVFWHRSCYFFNLL